MSAIWRTATTLIRSVHSYHILTVYLTKVHCTCGDDECDLDDLDTVSSVLTLLHHALSMHLPCNLQVNSVYERLNPNPNPDPNPDPDPNPNPTCR